MRLEKFNCDENLLRAYLAVLADTPNIDEEVREDMEALAFERAKEIVARCSVDPDSPKPISRANSANLETHTRTFLKRCATGRYTEDYEQFRRDQEKFARILGYRDMKDFEAKEMPND